MMETKPGKQFSPSVKNYVGENNNETSSLNDLFAATKIDVGTAQKGSTSHLPNELPKTNEQEANTDAYDKNNVSDDIPSIIDTQKSRTKSEFAAINADVDTVDEDAESHFQSELASITEQKLDFDKNCVNDVFDDIPSITHVQKSKIVSKSKFEVTETVMKRNLPQTELVPCNSCENLDPLVTIKTSCCFGTCVRHINLKTFTHFWLISVPKRDNTWELLNFETEKEGLSQNYKFHIPILKVGTLDVLISLTEQLKTLDDFVQGTTVKICEYMKIELRQKPSLLEENLKVKGLNPSAYLTRFTWNKAKYPTWNSTSLIADIIFTHVDRIQNALRKKINIFDELKSNLNKYENREREKLQYRYLGDIVKKEHFVLDSHCLVTLLVVVPNSQTQVWLKSYESMCDMVVPSSSQRIFSDATHSLFSVTLHKKNIENFKTKAKDNQFIVRDFQYSEKNMLSEKEYYENLLRCKTRQMAAIFRWAKVHFSESFEAWIHVKALRIYVESVLRFGLPVNYAAMLLIPLRSKKKLNKLLNKMYKDVDNSLAKGHLEEIPHALAMYGVQDYFPYVHLKLNIDFVKAQK